jgi:hypothetical protein
VHTERRRAARLQSENDHYVRLPQRQLEAIELSHLATTVEPELVDSDPTVRGCHGCIAGATEWCGRSGNRMLSIGWDWILLNDCAISILDPLHIRTNLMLTDRSDRDLGGKLTTTLILAFLTKLGWQRTVRERIAQPGMTRPS